MRISFLVLLAALFFASCGDGGNIPVDANGQENFEAFYKRFHEDTLFQFQRIEFPLAGVGSDGNPKVWDEDGWVYLKAVDPKNEDVKIYRETEPEFVKERMILQDALMMERNFTYDKATKKWLMTYYTDFHFPQTANRSNVVDTTTIDSVPSDHPNVDVEITTNNHPKKDK